ncbi:MAG: hypothetical protein ACFFAH_11590 [Promethearchaeota archaeon]
MKNETAIITGIFVSVIYECHVFYIYNNEILSDIIKKNIKMITRL